MKFVTNSSPLIFLAKLDALWLLRRHQVIVPSAVKEELTSRESFEQDRLEFFLKQKNVKVFKTKTKRSFTRALGKGETEVINLALEKKVPNVLLDDRRARSLAHLHKLKAKGTLWVILSAQHQCLINKKQTKEFVYDLFTHGFRLDEAVFVAVMKRIEDDAKAPNRAGGEDGAQAPNRAGGEE